MEGGERRWKVGFIVYLFSICFFYFSGKGGKIELSKPG